MADGRDLRASLLSIGPLLPGLLFDSVLVDGKKRAAICAELGIKFEIQEAQTLNEACSILWTRHPSRALELATRSSSSVVRIAELCSVSTTAIAKELRELEPKPKRSPNAARRTDQPYRSLKADPKMIRRLFVLEPELYAYAREAAAQSGHKNVSRIVREALWQKVAMLVPMAPQYQPQRIQAPNGARAQRRRTGVE